MLHFDGKASSTCRWGCSSTGPIFLRQANENRIVASWLQVDLLGECEPCADLLAEVSGARQIATIIENLILMPISPADASLDEGCFKFQGGYRGRQASPRSRRTGCQCPPTRLAGLRVLSVEEIDRLGRYHLIVRQKPTCPRSPAEAADIPRPQITAAKPSVLKGRIVPTPKPVKYRLFDGCACPMSTASEAPSADEHISHLGEACCIHRHGRGGVIADTAFHPGRNAP